MADEQQRLFSQELARKITDLRTAYEEPADQDKDKYRTVRQAFASFLEEVRNGQADAQTIRPDRFAKLFVAVWALDLLRDYTVNPPTAADENFEAKLNAALQRGTCEGLREARSILKQWRGGPTDNDILAAITSGNVSIETDSVIIGQNRTVNLRLRFNDPRLNDRDARDRFTAQWDFDHDNLFETGWEVAHYFPEPRIYNVTARFKDPKGAFIKDPNSMPTAQINAQPAPEGLAVRRPLRVVQGPALGVGERARTEIVQLAIVLLIALLGLMAGAREQLLKLDVGAGLIAVFLLGFSADTIKNLLVRKS
jgi:hypothetical protein